MKKSKTKSVTVVDLFCGVGGLTCGLQKAGLNVVAGFDSDNTCKFAYEYNNKAQFINCDISKIDSSEISKYYKKDDIKILVGCAPCQTFSRQTNKYKDRTKDEKWNLLKYYAKHIENIKPDIISMENVSELINFDIFQYFIDVLERNNYYISYKIVDCSKYGLPQKRRRLVLLASKFGQIDLIQPNKNQVYRTVETEIKNLPKLKNGEQCKTDPLHRCAKLTDLNLKRIKQSVPGGTWQDWDEELLPNCYKKSSGQSYSAVYGRMKWDSPSPTMTTQFYVYGTGRFGHPEQNRGLSLREGALLQTFPKEYKFIENDEYSLKIIGRHIGNAVPVDLGEVIGKSIQKHLEGYN